MSDTRLIRCHKNSILEDHGDWLLIDISTAKLAGVSMAVDKDVWERHSGGRVRATDGRDSRYVYAAYGCHKFRMFHADVVDGETVDHIKHGSKTFIDNRRINLRRATQAQNCMNRGVRQDNRSGAIGVRWHNASKKWIASIKVVGKQKHLGVFSNKSDAIRARKTAEEKYFGEFAYSK